MEKKLCVGAVPRLPESYAVLWYRDSAAASESVAPKAAKRSTAMINLTRGRGVRARRRVKRIEHSPMQRSLVRVKSQIGRAHV